MGTIYINKENKSFLYSRNYPNVVKHMLEKITEKHMARLVINDELWNRLELLLLKHKGRHGNNDRLFIEGVCWAIRTGCPWRDMPGSY